MSHGLGSVQRLMLFRLADHERVSEAAAERQQPYRSPDRWLHNTLMFSTFYDRFVGEQRAAHEVWQEVLRQWKDGDEVQRNAARDFIAKIVNICGGLHIRPPKLHPEPFNGPQMAR